MGFLIVNKNTGEVVRDKIYKSEGLAQGVINKTNVSDKGEWVVIPMPRADIIKGVAEGGWFSLLVDGGRLPVETGGRGEPHWADDFIIIDGYGKNMQFVEEYNYDGIIHLTDKREEAKKFGWREAERITDKNPDLRYEEG